MKSSILKELLEVFVGFFYLKKKTLDFFFPC